VRTWSGQNQSLSGFEKIRMVGKGVRICCHYTLIVFFTDEINTMFIIVQTYLLLNSCNLHITDYTLLVDKNAVCGSKVMCTAAYII